MTIKLSLSADLEAKLQQQALAAGKDVSAFVQEAVVEKLAGELNHLRTGTERAAAWREWAVTRHNSGRVADDTREGIYAGRGE
jgi:hypothetical protein